MVRARGRIEYEELEGDQTTAKKEVKKPAHTAGLQNINSKSKTEIPKRVRDDKKTRTKP